MMINLFKNEFRGFIQEAFSLYGELEPFLYGKLKNNPIETEQFNKVLEEIKESQISFEEYFEALDYFRSWVSLQEKSDAQLSKMNGYIHCCKDVTGGQRLAATLRLLLTQHGFEG